MFFSASEANADVFWALDLEGISCLYVSSHFPDPTRRGVENMGSPDRFARL